MSSIRPSPLLPRRKYPKTSVPGASDSHPCHFRSIQSTFGWANIFLKKIADVWGEAFLLKKLNKWAWDMSTSFSGVGCAESARYSRLAKTRCSEGHVESFGHPLPSQAPGAKAALSLQSAVRSFLANSRTTRMSKSHVVLKHTCEINPDCQEVLAQTYGNCNFSDILSLDLTRQTFYCTTHKKMCNVPQRTDASRSSLEINILSLVFQNAQQHPGLQINIAGPSLKGTMSPSSFMIISEFFNPPFQVRSASSSVPWGFGRVPTRWGLRPIKHTMSGWHPIRT